MSRAHRALMFASALLFLSGCGIPAEELACERLALAKIAYVTCLYKHPDPQDCKQPFHDLLEALDESQTVAWYWPGEHNPFVTHMTVSDAEEQRR